MRAKIPKDARALARFDRQSFPLNEDRCAPSYFKQRGLRSFWLLRNGRRIGACCLLHHATFNQKVDALYHRQRNSLYITSTAILPKYQKSGLGAVFKVWQIAYARAHGFAEIVTNIRTGNYASVRLNMKFGFVVTGRSENCYPDGESAWILKLQLTPSL